MAPPDRPGAAGVLPPKFSLRDGGILFLLCLASYGGNYFSIPLFWGVDLLLGGVAVMFTALRRSLSETLLVALVGSLHTLVLWGHPYALAIFVAEAAFVQILSARGGREATRYDALFWLAIGVPLIWLFYRVIMEMELTGWVLIALKQPVNGLFYTAIAMILHHSLLLRQWTSPPGHRPLRFADLLAPLFLIFVLLPTLAVVSANTRVERKETLTRLANELRGTEQYLEIEEPIHSGLLDLVAKLRERLRPMSVDGAAAALVAPGGVAVAQRPDAWLSRRPAMEVTTGGLVMRYPLNSESIMERERNAYFVHDHGESRLAGVSGFDLVVGIPAAPYIDSLRTRQLVALAITVAIAAGGVMASGVVARRTGRLLAPVIARVREVPANVYKGERPSAPRSPISEIATLADGISDIEDRLAHQVHELAESEQRFRTITTNLPGGVYQRRMDSDGNMHFTYLSPTFADAFGFDPESLHDDPNFLVAAIHPEDRPGYYAALRRSARMLSAHDLTFRVCGSDGRERWVRSLGQPRHGAEGEMLWDGIALDETARVAAETELEFLARYDALTGLLNRNETHRQLQGLLDDATVRETVAVFYVDLDGLKSINDTLGHSAGDELIQTAAQRIQSTVRGVDRVGRYGGDEFVILAPGIRDQSAAESVAARLLGNVSGLTNVGGVEIDLRATVGILTNPSPVDGPDECLRKADLALYSGKREGRATWSFYSPAMDAEHKHRINLVEDLRRTLTHPDTELFLEYHPKIDLASGHTVGVEALVRWQHPTEGRLPPDWFIPLAQETGTIEVLEAWVLRRACADLAAWRSLGPEATPSHVSVNISGSHLRGDALPHAVWTALSDNGLGPESLELEITESVYYMAQNEVLEQLASAGIALAVDDFGKGYSSLFVLRDSPARTLKIDRSFISTLSAKSATSEADYLIVENTVRLAHALERQVVAEGVETETQLEVLRGMGCDLAQGFYLSYPLPAELVPEFVRKT